MNAEKGVFRCHACNAQGGLVEFERRISGCDKSTAQRRIARLGNSSENRNSSNQIVKPYSYTNEEGELLFQQVRFEPKDFRFRRPAKNGGWIWNLEGVERVLYHLPEVLTSETVYVVEGEKDADTLRAWNLAATCNPGGAGKWKDEYSRSLKGKHVIILQDDDAPGRKHAEAVADSVARYAAEVSVVPPFPKAKDLTQWRERGGTKQKLQEIVASTEVFQRSEELFAGPGEGEALSSGNWLSKSIRGAWAVRLPERLFLDYLILPAGISLVASLWAIGTYLFDTFDCFPYLTILSPVKRCGKTRFGEILELLCCRSMMSTNISEAALFRSISSDKPCVILDEAEALRNKGSERAQYLLAILQAGFRQGAVVRRCVGKDHAVEKFSVYCPKAILAIGNLPDPLMDRSVVVSMRRHLPTEVVARFRHRVAAQQAAGTVTVISTWANTHKDQISRSYLKQNLEFLKDREADVWEPLFAIATVAVPERLEELKEHALRLSAKKAIMDEDDSQGMRLLADIRTIFNATKSEEVTSAELVERLKNETAIHWDEELTQIKVARLLRPFGISPVQMWMDEKNSRGYRLEMFEPAFERYLSSKNR